MAEAREHFQRALEIFRKIQDPRSVARLWVNLARVSYRQGDPESALRFLDESLSISRKLDTRWNLGYVLEILGLIERSKGNTARALTLFQESLNFSIEQENKQGIANCLGALAGLALMDQQHARATRLFAAADKLRWTMGAVMGQHDQEEYQGYLNKLQSQMETEAINAAWSEGHSATLEAVIEDLKEWSGSLPVNLHSDPVSLLPPSYDPETVLLDGLGHLPGLLLKEAG
jgi:tetratricopeptide (TPR) repeat protein